MELLFEDFEIISEGVATSFHKLILALHSSSFKPKKINITKNFIYTGRINIYFVFGEENNEECTGLETFTFYLIEDRFGKLENAMKALFNDENKPDRYEVRLWEDYCCINSLPRCCSDCTFINPFEILCIS